MKTSAQKIVASPCVWRFLRFVACSLFALAPVGCASLTHHSQFIDGRVDPRQHEARTGHLHYALPRGYVSLTIEQSSTALVITPPTTVINADPVARYGVHLAESGFADDKYVISIHTNGLLTSSKSDNFDKSPEIIQKAVELFSEGAKAIVSGRASGTSARGSVALRPISEAFIIDPFTTPQRKSRTGALIAFSNIDGSPLPRITSNDVAESAMRCQGSLCSRLLRPVRVKITLGDFLQREYVLMIPDPLLTISHDVTRSACVQRITTLTFIDGVLTTHDLNKPSEVLGCLNIPVAALKTIVGIPSALLTFRTEQIESRTGLTAANTANFNALVSRMDAQSNFLAALAARTPIAEVVPQSGLARSTATQAPTQTQALQAIEENRRLDERDNRCLRLNAKTPERVENCATIYNTCFAKKSNHELCLPQP